MAKKINSTLIGVFVLCALALFIWILFMLGGRSLFAQSVTYHLYFDKSVKGLNLGAPVMFRGVRIGEVKEIRLLPYSREGDDLVSWPIRVTVELAANSLDAEGIAPCAGDGSALALAWAKALNASRAEDRMGEWFQRLVADNGMRAQLQSLSILTGQLYIELNFFEDSPPSEQIMADLERHILPTRVSAFERFFMSLSTKEFGEQMDSMQLILTIVSDFIKRGDAEKALSNVVTISDNLRKLSSSLNLYLLPTVGTLAGVIEKADRTVGGLEERLPQLLDSADVSMLTWNETVLQLGDKLSAVMDTTLELLQQLERTVALEEGPAADLLAKLSSTLDGLDQALGEVSGLSQALQRRAAPNSPVLLDMQEALQELSRAAESLRALTDMLKRHPEVLLRGK
jgi:paraquat-inducible protein B